MPNLRSNKNKWSLPPYPPAAETVCIPVTIPNDTRWIGLFLGAIYRLSQQIWYDRDDQHTAKDVAAVWLDIYLDTVKKTWDCGTGMFDLRVSPDDECLIQKTNDGYTWTDAFRLDTDCALTKLIRNPYNGRIGWEVEDIGFYEVPDGPWVDNYPRTGTTPPPRPEATTDEKLCAAAANAAAVIDETYKQIAQRLLDVVAGTDWDYAAALGSVIQGVLMIIGAAAAQPYVALSTILGVVGVRQQYVDYPLDSDDIERLTCILLENAALTASDAVIFDFDGAWAAIDLDSPKNGLVRFLLTMLGPDALNYAGSVDFVSTADCSACDDDCEECVTSTRTHYLGYSNPAWSGGVPAAPSGGLTQGYLSVVSPATAVLDLPEEQCVSEVRLSLYNAYNGHSARWSAVELFNAGVSLGNKNIGSARTTCGNGTEANAVWTFSPPVRASQLEFRKGTVPAGVAHGDAGFVICAKITACDEVIDA